MKQHITKENLDTLSNKGREKLASWYADWQFKQGNQFVGLPLEIIDEKTMRVKVPLMSIGQMIDFLDIHIIYLENEAGWWGIKTTENLKDVDPMPELCDALWKVVKEILEASDGATYPPHDKYQKG